MKKPAVTIADPNSNTSLAAALFSRDHKVIGKQYFFLSLAAVLIGSLLSLLMRIHLVWPHASIPFFGQIKPEDYLGFLTIHGTLMVFFVLSTVPQNGFGTYFLPLQLGASEMAFPGLNRISFWTTLTALLVLLSAFFVTGGASIAGWTQYPPLSALGTTGPGQNLGTDLWLASIGLFCIGSVLSAINFVTTTARMRAEGMAWLRMPLTCWAWFITAILSLLAFSILLGALILLRHFGVSITPILTAFGVGGLAVALALQDTLSNLFAGFYISVAGQVRLGDYIKLNTGEEGYVTDISWRSTTIRALGNNLIIIPNAKLAQAVVTNYYLPERRMALNIPVGVSYTSDVDKVERVLIEEVTKAAGAVTGLLAEPAPIVRLMPGFGDSSLNFTLTCNVAEFVDQFLVQHELRKRILKRFAAERIEMPFPTPTVYVREQAGA